MRVPGLAVTAVLLVSVVDVVSAQTQFESSKLSPGAVVQGSGSESSKLSPGIVLQGSGAQSSKLSPGVVLQGASLQASKMSIGVVVQSVPGGGGVVVRAPLTHW
jgi:hypothetical protein